MFYEPIPAQHACYVKLFFYRNKLRAVFENSPGIEYI